MGSFLDLLLLGLRRVFHNGSPVVPPRQDINFIGGTVVDNPILQTTDITLGGGGGGSGYTPLTYTSIFIDPQDSTGHASDTNPGTSGLPLLTTAKLNSINFQGSLTANTSISYLSEDTSGTGLNLSTMFLGIFNLDVIMTPVALHAGGTLNAGTTAINPTGNQRQLVHTSDLSSFAPYVLTTLGGSGALPTWLLDTVNSDSVCVASGVATASASRPVTAGGAAGALTSGDSYKIQRGGQLTLSAQTPPVSDGGVVTFTDCAFTATSVGFDNAQYTRCSWSAFLQVSGFLTNCFVAAGCLVSNGTGVTMSGGVLVTTVNDEVVVPLTLSGDTYVTGAGIIFSQDTYASVFITQGIGLGVQVQDTANFLAGIIAVGDPSLGSSVGVFGGANALVWGSGNAGKGMIIAPGGNPTVSSTAGLTPLVTGSLGDFGFLGEAAVGTLSVARAFDASTGAYTEAGGAATRSTTWAHFAASIGSGGFAFQAHNPSTNASLVGV